MPGRTTYKHVVVYTAHAHWLTSSAFSCTSLRSCSSATSLCSRKNIFLWRGKETDYTHTDTHCLPLVIKRNAHILLPWFNSFCVLNMLARVTDAWDWVWLSLMHSFSSFSSFSCWFWRLVQSVTVCLWREAWQRRALNTLTVGYNTVYTLFSFRGKLDIWLS